MSPEVKEPEKQLSFSYFVVDLEIKGTFDPEIFDKLGDYFEVVGADFVVGPSPHGFSPTPTT